MTDEENTQSYPPAKQTKAQKIAAADVPQLMKCLKVINSLIASGLIAAGIVTLLGMSGKDEATGKAKPLDLSKSFSAIYIILFSVLLIVFELHCCVKLDLYIFTYFGFMYSITGRFLFFLFIGTLGFALDIFGIIMGAITVLVVIFNVWVIRNNSEYLETLRQKNIASRLAAEKAVLSKHTGVEMQDASSDFTAAKPPKGDDWERMYDDEADSYYYYNNKTKETRWDNNN